MSILSGASGGQAWEGEERHADRCVPCLWPPLSPGGQTHRAERGDQNTDSRCVARADEPPRRPARVWRASQYRDSLGQQKAHELKALPASAGNALPPPDELVIELDELWTFVGKKRQARWLWMALERSTRRVLTWVIGDRRQATAFNLWDRLPLTPEQRLKATFCTELWAADDEPLLGVKRITRTGQTNHVERLTCTLRQRLGRLVRTSLSCSKSDDMLDAALTLAVHRYNASR